MSLRFVEDMSEKLGAHRDIRSFVHHLMLLRSTVTYFPHIEKSKHPIVRRFQRLRSRAIWFPVDRKRDAPQMKPMFSRSPALQVPSKADGMGDCGVARWSL